MGIKVDVYVASETCDDLKTLVSSRYPEIEYIGDIKTINDQKVCCFCVNNYLLNPLLKSFSDQKVCCFCCVSHFI